MSETVNGMPFVDGAELTREFLQEHGKVALRTDSVILDASILQVEGYRTIMYVGYYQTTSVYRHAGESVAQPVQNAYMHVELVPLDDPEVPTGGEPEAPGDTPLTPIEPAAPTGGDPEIEG